MNEIIRNLTMQSLNNFKNSFEETKKVFWDEKNKRLTHSGEFGEYREELVKSWLRVVVPEKFGISSGFLVTDKGSVSTQCDLIIYDKTITPKIENIDKQRFFPVETVACVGEVKSDINSIGDLNEYLIKLAEIKKFRQEVTSPMTYISKFGDKFSPHTNSYDNIYSFLICNKFNFNFDVSKIEYGHIEQQFKHNVILSLNDGIVNYKTEKGTTNLSYPFNKERIHIDSFTPNNKAELPIHFSLFLSSLQIALNITTILSIDITNYLTDNVWKKIE